MPIFPWTRYWSPRGEAIPSDPRGYLADPNPVFRLAHKPELLTLDELREIPCLVLLGEPGMGKSTAMPSSTDDHDDGERGQTIVRIIIDLKSCAPGGRLLLDEESFLRARESGNITELYLDSFDECHIRIDNLPAIVEKQLVSIPKERLRLRIACRTAVWPTALEKFLHRHWGEGAVKFLELAALRRCDVLTAARMTRDIDADRFMNEVEEKEVVPLAIKPITLRLLLESFALDGTLPATQAELYRKGCRILCEEANEGRQHSSRLKGQLDASQRVAIAGRLAAVTVFCNRPVIWIKPDLGDAEEGDLTFSELVGPEVIDGQDFRVSEACIREVLDTGLFSARGLGRMGFAHQTYAEFLAADYLQRRGVELPQVASILLHHDDNGGQVVPQLQEAAAWLAGMDSRAFDLIMQGDPKVLLRTDVSTDRPALVEALLRLLEEGKITDEADLRSRYRRLNHPDLAAQLAPVIGDKKKDRIARRFAIKVAQSCNTDTLDNFLADVALDSSDDDHIRTQAAYALSQIGSPLSRLRLLPCLDGAAGPDPEDELRGCALMALWPDLIDVKRALAAITPRQSPSLWGVYSSFLNSSFARGLKGSDMAAALEWLSLQAPDPDKLGLGHLSEPLIVASLAYLDDSRTCDAFAKIVAKAVALHIRNLIEHRRDLGRLTDMKIRRNVALTVIRNLDLSTIEPAAICFCYPPIVMSSDINWMLGFLDCPVEHVAPATWAKLVRAVYDGSVESLEAVLVAVSRHEVIAEKFRGLLEPLELASQATHKLREDYYLFHGPRTEPTTPTSEELSDRMEMRLTECEAGKLDAWWWLNLDMTGARQGRNGLGEAISDLRLSRCWAEAGSMTRERTLGAAERYLIEYRGLDDGKIESGGYRPSDAGYRAFRLLDSERHGFLDSLSASVWAYWVPSILTGSLASKPEDSETYARILGMAYGRVPDTVIETLIRFLLGDNGILNLSSARDIAACWDSRISLALREKARDPSLKSVHARRLFHLLIEHGDQIAEDYARSSIQIPLPVEVEPRARSLALASALIRYSPDAGWPVLDEILRLDPDAGEELIVAESRQGRSSLLDNRLTEEQLATLYRWVATRFPPHLDEIIYEVHRVEDRELVGRFRDAILSQLQHRGTHASRMAIGRLVKDLPQIPWLNSVAVAASEITLRQTWKALEPATFLSLVNNRSSRLIASGSQLLAVVTESLVRLEQRLQGETPQAQALWDQVKSGIYRPKEENWLSDYVVDHLRDDLAGRGIVLGREVQIRRKQGNSPGELTDIHVDAVAPENTDTIKVIIEVKGCWNQDLRDAMKVQLVDRYLCDNDCRHGLYLVGWYECPQWDRDDPRKSNHKSTTPDELRTFLEHQAHELSSNDMIVQPFILDATLR